MAGDVVRIGSFFDTKAIEAGFARIQRGVRNVNHSTSQLNQGFSKIGRGFAVGIRSGVLIASAAIGTFTSQVGIGLARLIELDRITRQTQAVITSTGGAAGISAEQVRKLAEQFENFTSIDDKAIQSTENMLLTFTNIGAKGGVFESALGAVLDMNQAMGGDENSLVDTAIRVGKALNDPIRGVTALRRVGVQLTDQQLKQIKAFVKSGDLLSAQKIILKELAVEFGGSAGAFGQSTEGKIRRVGDAIEDAQKALATAFLPAIERVAAIISTKLQDPGVLAQIESIGTKVAGLFSEENIGKAEDAVKGLFETLGEVPWGTIGEGLKITGRAAKVAVDAFLKLPPNVQGALITLLAANKLTGGLVASGIGDIAGFVLKSLGGRIFAANVTVVGTNVISPGGGIPGGGKGGPGLLTVIPVVLAAGASIEFGITAANYVKGISDQTAQVDDKMGQFLDKEPNKATIEKQLAELRDLPNHLDPIKRALFEINAGNVHTTWQRQIDKLQGILDASNLIAARIGDLHQPLSTMFPTAGAINQPVSTLSATAATNYYGGSTPPTYSHAMGGVRLAHSRTGAIYGEAGDEAGIFLRYPKFGPPPWAQAWNGPASTVINKIFIGPREITQRQRRSDIWHSVVEQ